MAIEKDEKEILQASLLKIDGVVKAYPVRKWAASRNLKTKRRRFPVLISGLPCVVPSRFKRFYSKK